MDNTLKFRAWDKVRKQMVTDFVIAPTNPTWSAHLIRDTSNKLSNLIYEYYTTLGDILASNSYSVLDWSDYYGINNYIIMQFTGLVDKNGVEVFEGDILEVVSDNDESKFITTFKVDLVNGLSVRNSILFKDMLLYDYSVREDNCKVIGNIYEHSNLLNNESNT